MYRKIETICGVNANSIESHIVMHSGNRENKIAHYFETDNSYWETHTCLYGMYFLTYNIKKFFFDLTLITALP